MKLTILNRESARPHDPLHRIRASVPDDAEIIPIEEACRELTADLDGEAIVWVYRESRAKDGAAGKVLADWFYEHPEGTFVSVSGIV